MLSVLKGDRSRFKVSDSWVGSVGTYVVEYREKIDLIARELSGDGGLAVHTRYSKQHCCAELHTCFDSVLARVRVEGSEGAPWRAMVMHNGLTEEQLQLFKCLRLELQCVRAIRM